MKHLFPDRSEKELTSKAHEWSDQLGKFRESFEESFESEVDASGATFINILYLLFIIGSSALIGWLVSLPF